MDEICRLCLRNDDNKKNIFDELLLSKSLYWTFGVQIKVSDKFSKLICEQCVNQLEYVRQLKTFYQKNQQYLHQQKFPLEFDSEVGNYDWLLERTTKLPEIPPILRSIPKDVCSAKKPKIDCTTGVLQYNIQDNLQSEKRIEHVNGLVPVVELPRLGDISEDGYRKINNNLYKKTSKKNPIQYRKKSIQHNSKLKSTLPFSVGKKVTANNGKHINNFIQRQKSKLYEYEEATAVNRQCDVDEITSKTTDPAKICDINGDISSKVNKTIIMKQAEKSDKTDDVLSKTSKITTDENSYVNNQKLVMRDVLRESQNFLNFIENKSTDQTTTVITIDDDKVPVNENLPPNNNQNMPINVTREKADISSINLIPEQFLVPGNDVQIIAVQQPNWNPKSFEVSETSMISANNKDLQANTRSVLIPVLSRLGDVTDDGYTKRNTYLYKKTSKENSKYQKKSILNNETQKSHLVSEVNLQLKSKLPFSVTSTDANRKRGVEKITSKTNKKLKVCDINGKVNKTIICNQAVKSENAEKRNSNVHNKKLVMRNVLRESQKTLNFVEDKSMDGTTVITIHDDEVELNKNLPADNNHNTPINVMRQKSYISSSNIIPEKFLLPDGDVQITLVTQSQKTNPIVPHVQTIKVDDGMQGDTNDTARQPNSFELPGTLLFSPNDKENSLLRERKKSDIQTWKKIQKYLNRVIFLGNSDIKKHYKRVLENVLSKVYMIGVIRGRKGDSKTFILN